MPDRELASEADEVSPGRLGRSVLGNLALFTLSLAIPVLAFVTFLLGQFALGERGRLEGEASDLAQNIAAAVDRDLAGVLASVDVLSTSYFLKIGDMRGFRAQANELLERQGIVTVLTDMSGQHLVNMRLAEDARLPKSRVLFTEAELAQSPFATDLVVGQVTGKPQFLAVTTVQRNGKPAYVLYFSLSLERLQRILQESEIPAGYTASIVDRKGLIMARNLRPEEFVGREATPDLQHSTTERRGTWSGTTADGVEVFGAYSRSRLSDFRAAVGVRYADLNAPMWRSLGLVALLGAAIVILSVLLGLLFGRRITGPIGALAREAARLGRGEPVMPLSTGLREADQVGAELAAASAALREREAELRDATEEMQRFAYIVSHDLRSPLVNIMGFTTELEALRADVFARLEQARSALQAAERSAAETSKDSELGQDFDEAIGFIKASIAKMDRLINAILQLSREGRREFSPVRVDMNALMAGIKASLASQADQADATVTISPLPALVSDRLAVEQIFSNLVDNALKYLRRGVPGRIEVTGRSVGRNQVYEVRDNGRGIDPKDSERVFDLFRRSGVQDRPGEGIGLAHVRTLVRRLGGTITLTSSPGKGSTFTVTLPRRWAGERQRKAA